MSANKIMTTKELAQYIQLNEKTIIKMAQNGEIPGVKIGNQWRFHLASIDQHLQNGVVQSRDEDLDVLIHTEEYVTAISRFTHEKGIVLDAVLSGKEQILTRLVKIAEGAGVVRDAENLLIQMGKREELLSTAIGEGVAIPHPRNPSKRLFQKNALIILRTKKAIEYDAPDGKPVQLFFMTCALNEVVHLRLLAKIARLLHVSKFKTGLMEAKKPQDVLTVLMTFDRECLFAKSV